jgi:Domain of unknown function (DUF6532)
MYMTSTQKITNRFLAPQISEAIWGKYFEGRKMRGIVEPNFLDRINGTMICLTCAILCHTLRAWQTGIYKDPGDFKHDAVGGESQHETYILIFPPGR